MAKEKKQADLPIGYFWRRGSQYIWFRTDPLTGGAKSSNCKTLEAARAEYTKRETEARDPVQKAGRLQTFSHWADEAIKWKTHTKSAGTAEFYWRRLTQVIRVFGARRPIAEFDAAFVDEYIKIRRAEGTKANTIQRDLTCIGVTLKLARRGNAYPHDPRTVMPIGFSPKYVPTTRTISALDLPKLLDVLTEGQKAWVLFAIAVGGDIGDVERAEPGDYNPAAATILVRGTKTKTRHAIIPVPEMYREFVEFAVARMPLTWSSPSKRLPEACAKAGIPKVSPKDLRRTGATWLAEAGVANDLLAKWLRQKGEKVSFQVYNQMSASALGDLIRNQIRNVTASTRPLGEMADAGDLKSARHPTKPTQDANKRQNRQGLSRDAAKLRSDLLQRANGRVRAISLRASVDTTLAPGVALAKCLPLLYEAADGDTEALGQVNETLVELATGAGS